ncbi:IS66 family insertion sequence element accessory protein TnpB [Bradyrhizobium sp. WSM3983]|uniref:IS66 family insertion sequence element accessory protein TnpB n=1 Tax=Bradyrhizobium sp. WSM3983 TaxID=1038867 RepID=UPI0004211EDB
MIAAGADLKIYIATRPIDFRFGHDELATKVQEMLRLDPFSDAAFVFRSKRADRIKILVWDRTGQNLTLRPAACSQACAVLPEFLGYGLGARGALSGRC